MKTKINRTRLITNTSAVNWICPQRIYDSVKFHKNLNGYSETKLISVPTLAKVSNLKYIFIKDESARFGLPAFKALGTTWAIDNELRRTGADLSVALVCATDGNHGRAVARTAASLGRESRIYIPNGVSEFAINAIADEGAKVIRINGDYDEAVRAAAQDADQTGALLIQDTAWDGYETVPSWIVEGYSTMVVEVDEQLEKLGLHADLVMVPTGVGSLLQAVIAHYRAQQNGAKVVSVEPINAGGVFESLKAGKLVSVPTETTIMTGLNCGTPSNLAMPYILNGLSAAVLVDDDQARQSLAELTELGVAVGPCGAAALAGIKTLANSKKARSELGLNSDSVVVLLSTESVEANPI